MKNPIGTYTPQGVLKTKAIATTKRENKTYKGKPTKKRKEQKKNLNIIILIFLAFIIGYISDSKNEFVIDAVRVSSSEVALSEVIPRREIENTTQSSELVNTVLVEEDMQSWVLRKVKEAGLDPDIAFNIIKCESNWKPEAYGVNKNGSTDFGLWQINSIHKAEISPKERLDYKIATEWAINKRLKDGNWSAWYSSAHCWNK